MKMQTLSLSDKKVVVVDDILNQNEMIKLHFMATRNGLVHDGATNYGDEKTKHYVSLVNIEELKKLSTYQSIEKALTQYFELPGVDCSLAIYRETNFGDHVEYHSDTSRNSLITAVIFLNTEWNKNFHGETQLLDEDGIGLSILPKPGRILFFDSSIDHSASTPSRICYDSRKVLVLDFKLTT